MDKRPVPLPVLFTVSRVLKKTLFSRNFYDQVTTKCLTTSSAVDANLYFLCYLTKLVAAILVNRDAIREWLKRNVGVDLGPITGAKLKLAGHLLTILSYIADVRIFNRLTDLIKYMPWAIDEFAALVDPANPVPRVTRFINFLQAVNCIVLELFENAGWLTDHNFVGTDDNPGWSAFTYVWCLRVWAAYVVIEIIELFRRVPLLKWDKNWKIAVFRNAVQIPLVVHWSLYEGCLSPFWVGLCGTGASWWGFKDLWTSVFKSL